MQSIAFNRAMGTPFTRPIFHLLTLGVVLVIIGLCWTCWGLCWVRKAFWIPFVNPKIVYRPRHLGFWLTCPWAGRYQNLPARISVRPARSIISLIEQVLAWVFFCKFHLPFGQVSIRNYLPQLKFYLPRAGGQCLMSSPA